MRVLFTLHDNNVADAGGMGVTVGLSEVYERLGHSAECLSFGDLPGFLPFGVKALVFPAFAAARLRRTAADVVDASCGDAWVWSSLRGRGRRTAAPLLVTRSHGLVHIADIARRQEAERGGIDLSWKYPLYWGGYRLWEVANSFRRADLCLFLNDHERDFAVESFGIPQSRTRVVDNGIPDGLLGLPLEPPPDPARDFRIAHVGSYLPLKGVRYAVAALERVFSRHPQASASFIGAGCEPERVLRDFSPEHRSRVTVKRGFRRQEMPGLLRGHAAAISATLKEGFPLGTLEAMACSLTVVTAATPGPLQYVRDGENGLVVGRADGAALASGIERLIADPELLGRLRSAAHATAQGYTWDRVGRETLGLYEEALEHRASATPQSP